MTGYANISIPLLIIQLITWNARGLWHTKRERRKKKRFYLSQAVKKTGVAVVQESHVRNRKRGALRRWAIKNGFTVFRTRTRRGRLGGLIIFTKDFLRKYVPQHNDILPGYVHSVTLRERREGVAYGPVLR